MKDAVKALREVIATSRPGGPLHQAVKAGVAEIERLRVAVRQLRSAEAEAMSLVLSHEGRIETLTAERDEARSLYTETEQKLSLLQSPLAVQELEQQVCNANNERDAARKDLDNCRAESLRRERLLRTIQWGGLEDGEPSCPSCSAWECHGIHEEGCPIAAELRVCGS